MRKADLTRRVCLAKQIALRPWTAGLLLAAATFGPSMSQEADNVEAVEPGGPGVLTKCRDWLVASSCKRYHHITLPPRITVGDTIRVTFGSSPKEYAFPVARIAQKNGYCVIFSDTESDRHHVDKIKVAPCYPVNTGR
jgi:hypothetical protein